MVVPATYDVTILVNDVDVTRYVSYESMSLDDYARQVSTFRMVVENPSGVTPARQHTVKVTWNFDDSVIFIGYIMALETKKRDNGITIQYHCECADRKILLQRTVIGGNTFTGSDLDILGDLLSNAYPDLSDLFDFASDVTSFADGLDLPIEDGTNLLDALNDLADLSDADFRFENGNPDEGGTDTVTFDTGGYATYTINAGTNTSPAEEAQGNPDDCVRDSNDFGVDTNPVDYELDIEWASPVTVTNIAADFFQSSFYQALGTYQNTQLYIYFYNGVTLEDFIQIQGRSTQHDVWHAFDFDLTGSDPGDTTGYFMFDWLANTWASGITVDKITLRFENTNPVRIFDWRLDNIAITQSGDGKNDLQWDNEPDVADFDIDVQTGDEYASDIDFSVGSFDDFNSVTVIGGFEEIEIDKALDNDGGRDHIALPYPVKTLAVYTNTGTDTTPAWGSALDLGAWGSDLLTGDGGDKDVLYDATNNVLFFDTAPPNLVNSYRITGTIQRPIRVRVESVAEGELTLATSYSDETVTSIDQAVAIGAAQLEQKNSIRQLKFKTKHPGLKAGQSITVTDSARGLAETVTITRIGITWLGSGGHAVFDVECGDADDSLATTLVNIDRQASSNSVTTSPDTQTAYLLSDNSGVLMTDNSGSQLYYIA